MNKLHQLLAVKLAVAAIMVAAVVVASAPQAHALFSRHASPEVADGAVRIPLDEVSDGKAHYYHVEIMGKDIRFFVVQSPDGVVRAAFDACDVCFESRKGYEQDGEYMVCANCGQRFHVSRINEVQGGCNPAPLARAEQDGEMVIALDDLVQGARFF